MRKSFSAGCLIAGALSACAPSASAADAERGKELFQACAACHIEGPSGNALGPSLKGVVGRKAASLEDFRYSAAMTRSNIIWDEADLRAYLINPQEKVKGNRMPYPGVADPADADNLVAYLKTYK